jgi:hypothetical protein
MSIFTVKRNGSAVTWNIDRACREVVAPIAREFGMSLEAFLEKFSFERLPGQLPNRDFAEDRDENVELKVDLNALSRSEIWPRLVRAAASEEMTVEEFLSEAIMDDVRACEEGMILSPKTGKPIASAFELRDFIVEEQHKETCED